MAELFIIRGLPGSGKSTLARKLCPNVFEADQFFECNGVYKFEPHKLKEAHENCKIRTLRCLNQQKNVAVANTFTQKWEYEDYLGMVKLRDRVTIINLFDAGMTDEELAIMNTHGVPVETIVRMRARFEH